MGRILRTAGLLAWLLALPGSASGQAKNTTPIGGRASLSGDTGVALGRDGSAPFSNPATIVRIHDAQLALSANLYAFSSNRLDAFHRPVAVDATRFPALQFKDTAATDNTLDILPSTVCFFFNPTSIAEGDVDGDFHDEERTTKPGRNKAAFCIGNVDRREIGLPALDYRALAPLALTQQVGTFVQKWQRWHSGPSFAMNVTSRFAVGVSVHGVYTYSTYNQTIGTVTTGGPVGATTSTFGGNASGFSIDLNAILGATYRFGERATVGFSAQLPSIHVFGKMHGNQYETYSDASSQSSSVTSASGDYSAPPPVRLAAGVGFQPRPDLTLEFDVAYSFPMTRTRSNMHFQTLSVAGASGGSGALDRVYETRTQPGYAFMAGGELFMTPTFSILGGTSLDLTSTPPLDATASLGNFTRDRTSRFSLSAGIGSYGNGTELLIGTQLYYGWGEALVTNPYVVPNGNAIVGMNQFGALIILAGSTSIGSVKRAVKDVQNIVK
ncbi:MAG: hypothetical protein U0169_01645 [Polyangiaceae bacterium]